MKFYKRRDNVSARRTTASTLSPSIAGRYVYWVFSNHSDLSTANGWVARCDLLTGRTTAALAPGYLDAVAADTTRPLASLLISSFSQQTNKVKSTNQIATLDAPSCSTLPAELHLTRCGPGHRYTRSLTGLAWPRRRPR